MTGTEPSHFLLPRVAATTYGELGVALGLNGHPLGEPLDDDAAEQFVIEVITGKLELGQIALGLVGFVRTDERPFPEPRRT